MSGAGYDSNHGAIFTQVITSGLQSQEMSSDLHLFQCLRPQGVGSPFQGDSWDSISHGGLSESFQRCSLDVSPPLRAV